MLKPYPATRSAGLQRGCRMGAGRSQSTTKSFEHIDAARLPGETDDDTVSRLLRLAIGGKPN